jgi:broad specificity phosphatase PhoE
MTIQLKNFYFIRHGETDWNFKKRCMGQSDIPLNITGKKQAEHAKRLLCNADIETICFSPLVRAKETALILNEILDCPLVEIENLKECQWGEQEGKLKGDGSIFNKWKEGDTPFGAESFAKFLQRTVEAINEALNHPKPLIVAHGGIYWALLKSIGQENNPLSKLPNATPIYHRTPTATNESWFIKALEESYKLELYEGY